MDCIFKLEITITIIWVLSSMYLGLIEYIFWLIARRLSCSSYYISKLVLMLNLLIVARGIMCVFLSLKEESQSSL